MRDNDTTAILHEGDIIITPDNQAHAVYNDSDDPVELIALIISREQGVSGKSVPLA